MLMPPISVMDIPPVMLAVRHSMNNHAPGRVSRISSNTEHATISVCSFAAYLFTQRAKLTNSSQPNELSTTLRSMALAEFGLKFHHRSI